METSGTASTRRKTSVSTHALPVGLCASLFYFCSLEFDVMDHRRLVPEMIQFNCFIPDSTGCIQEYMTISGPQ